MRKFIEDYSLQILAGVTILMAFSIGGFVIGGVFMGLVTTLAVWLSIQNLPTKIYNFIAKHPFLADMAFLKLSFAIFALIGTGPTMFMALVTQAVALGLLLKTIKQRDANGNHNRHESGSTVQPA